MTSEEFKTAKAALGATYAKLASILHVDERTVRRWASGESKIPGPVAFSMQTLIDSHATPPKGETT